MLQKEIRALKHQVRNKVHLEIPEFDLPPLPPVSDPKLYKIALSHTSSHGVQEDRSAFATESDELVEDYERLEHVGDALLGAVVCTLIFDLWPSFDEGLASRLKDCLVCNTTLAVISKRYGLPQLLIAHPTAIYTTQREVKAQGSMLEAYIAAVYYSYLWEGRAERVDEKQGKVVVEQTKENETQAQVTSQQDNPTKSEETSIQVPSSKSQDTQEGQVTADEVMEEVPARPDEKTTEVPTDVNVEKQPPNTPTRTQGDAFNHIANWLRPVFAPLAKHAYSRMSTEYAELLAARLPSPPPREIPDGWSEEEFQCRGAPAMLHSWCMKQGLEGVRYTDRRDGIMWEVTCTVVTDHDKEVSSSVARSTKQKAKSVAAYKVCKELNLFE